MMNLAGALALILTVAFTDPCSGSEQKKFILINGGGSVSSNYSVHETDIQVFDSLFGGNSIILNANGNESLVLPVSVKNDYFQRDFGGWVMLRKTSLDTNRKATRAEFFNIAEDLSANSPQELTVVYGDHGAPDGIVLWGGDKLNANDIKSAYSKLPNTTIRSIHLHCYGGAAVVDPNKKIPSNARELISTLKQHYLPNKCALTLSAETEPGQYYSWTDDPRQSSWKKLFEKNKKPSLLSIKQEIAKDDSFHPSPLLTSDYILKDVATAVCRNPPIAPDYIDSAEKCDPTNFNELFILSTDLRRDLCARCISSNVVKLDEAYKKIELIDDDLTSVRQDFQIAYLKNAYPGRYRELESAYRKYEKELANSLTAEGPKNSQSSSVELERLGQVYADKFLVDFLALDYKEDQNGNFEKYFNTLNRSWVIKNKDRFPYFSRFYLSQIKETSPNTLEGIPPIESDFLSIYQSTKSHLADKMPSPRKLEETLKTLLSEIQTARKAEELSRQEACRGVAEPLLKNSKDAEIRRLYESIGKCESSSIN